MRATYRIGDLVHIPQSVNLIDCDVKGDPQLSIPLKVLQTLSPTIGVITYISKGGYVRVFCDGEHWSVKDKSVYKLG